MSNFTASKLIAIAQAEIGYHEKASNKQLDNKTANAGSANYQKYGRDLNNAGYYNGNKNGYEWCDQFVDWCFLKLCGGKTKAEYIECQTGDLGAGCGYSMQYYKNAGRFNKTPKVGDQIFFRYSGNSGADHTGIVIAVTSSKITTVEGNKNNQVSKCVYARNYDCILGYGHPRYDAEVSATSNTTTKEVKNTVNIELNILKNGSTGKQVKTLQRLLRQLEYVNTDGKTLIEVDGSFGTNTFEAVKRFQKNKGASNPDGIVGAWTWGKLLKG